MGYKGHKAEWNRDKGSVPGHSTKHPKLAAHSQAHTSFEARGWSADKGSNTSAEGYHTNFTNRRKHDEDACGPNKARSSHDPLPQAYHSNSGTSSDGHRLIRRGASKFPVG